MQHWFTYPNIDPIAIHLGSWGIHWYGIAYLVAFLLVYLWMSRPEGRRRLGLTRDQIQDFLFYALIGVLVGGRTFFVINDIISKHDASLYFSNPINFVAVWNGGMAFHGGLIGVLVAIWLFVRKHPGLRYTVVGDEVVMMLPIGIALVRIVNFINDELWGDPCRPDHPWCLIFPAAPLVGGAPVYRHPSQIYEMILDLCALPILLLLYRTKPKDGVVAWTWFTIYGVTRTIAEIWRQAGFSAFGMTGGQL
jgi:phosphatidylglycerol---prolipoprotein diacylglyceryl transferase